MPDYGSLIADGYRDLFKDDPMEKWLVSVEALMGAIIKLRNEVKAE